MTPRFARMTCLIWLAAWPAIPGCSKPAPPDPVAYHRELATRDLRVHWEAQVPLAPDETVRDYFLSDGALYAVTDQSSVVAFNTDAGAIAWSRKLEPGYARVFRPSYSPGSGADDSVTLTSQSVMLVVDRRTGKTQRAIQLTEPPAGPGVASADLAWYNDLQGQLRAIDLQTLLTDWTLRHGSVCTAAPVLLPDMLIVATRNGQVYAMTPIDKRFLWRFEARGPVSATPVVAGDWLIVASEDRRVYAVDLDTGEMVWQYLTTEPLSHSPVVAVDTVYQQVGDKGLLALDFLTGAERWYDADARRFVARDGNVVYALDVGGDLTATRADTGRRLWAVDARSLDMVAVNDRDGALYLGSADGLIRCFRDRAAPYLRSGSVEASLRRTGTGNADLDADVSAGAAARQAGDVPRDPLESTSGVPPVTLRGGQSQPGE